MVKKHSTEEVEATDALAATMELIFDPHVKTHLLECKECKAKYIEIREHTAWLLKISLNSVEAGTKAFKSDKDG